MSIVTSVRLAEKDGTVEDSRGAASYELTWRVDVDAADYSGQLVVEQGRALSGASRIPLRGEHYNFGGLEDLGSFATEFKTQRIIEKERNTRWAVSVSFRPPDPSTPVGVLQEPNPLLWPVVYDIDYQEEQVPLDKAVNLDDLTHVGRPAGTYGPVVNSCGVEFTEGLMRTVYYPVLVAVKNYESLSDIIALNLAYQGTGNYDTFFGSAPWTAKYITTESGGLHNVNGQSFYPGTTRIIFKKENWDRRVLNNGWSHLERNAADTGYVLKDGRPALFKNLIQDNATALEADANIDPKQPCSEPLNLALNGTILPSDTSAIYLTYEDLIPATYSGIGIGG